MFKLNTKKLYSKIINTPIGAMIAYTTDVGIVFLKFEDQKNIDKEINTIEKKITTIERNSNHKHLVLLEQELKKYFLRDIQKFSVPLHLIGTEFQTKVWNKLLNTQYGTTISYKQQSENINSPQSVRAVANANGANKTLIIVPCHRVIGTNGKLTGYSGEVWRKKELLELELGVKKLL